MFWARAVFFLYQKAVRKLGRMITLNPMRRDMPDFKNHIQKHRLLPWL